MSRGKPTTDPPAGFADLVREHWEPVFRYLMSHARRTHDAEELTQETFLRALGHWPTRDPDTRPRAWLLRIAGVLKAAARQAAVKEKRDEARLARLLAAQEKQAAKMAAVAERQAAQLLKKAKGKKGK